MRAIREQPWPLYVRVLMKDAVRWRSSMDVSELVLPANVDAAVNQLLDDVEQQLGQVLGSHTLAFITAAHNGLCEVRPQSARYSTRKKLPRSRSDRPHYPDP